ncbi:MAG: sigma-70 family RNA polymerase sigma factor [Actinomycetota bacterium]
MAPKAEPTSTPPASAVERAYSRYSLDAKKLAFLLTRDEAQAEDLMQDAFIRVLGRMNHLRHPEAFWSYLRRTVIHLSISQSRRTRSERDVIGAVGSTQLASGITRQDLIIERESMIDRIRALPSNQRVAVVLRYYEDLTVREIATIMRTSEGTVRSWLSRAMKALAVQHGKEQRDDDRW